MTLSTLTAVQNDVLEYIKWFQTECGCGPSYEEIREKMGWKSKSGVHRVVQGLIKRGFIRKLPYHARHYEIIDQNSETLADVLRAALPLLLKHDFDLWLRAESALEDCRPQKKEAA